MILRKSLKYKMIVRKKNGLVIEVPDEHYSSFLFRN